MSLPPSWRWSTRPAPRWPERDMARCTFTVGASGWPRVLARWQLPAGLLLSFCLVGSACKEDEEPNWVQFNATDDTLEVQVGVEELLDPVDGVLHSNTGEVEIGAARVDPGGGPIGTEHEIVVEVYDDWENEIERATVRADSSERGKDEYELLPDSADEGIYKLVIVSVGDEGEQRSDELTFRLWYDDTEASADDGSEGGDTAE